MTDSSGRPSELISYQCPACGHSLPRDTPVARFDAPCSGCGHHVWCRKRVGEADIILELLPDRTPEPQDVEGLARSLIEEQNVTRCVIDLSRLDLIDSALVARLISLNRRFRAAERQLVLTGLRPLLREMFEQLHIDRAFEIEEVDEETSD